MIENREIKINVLPLIFVPNKILNSLCKIIIILIHKKFHRDGISQYIEGINNNPRKVLSQFNEKIFVEGSKELNKFVIIFN